LLIFKITEFALSIISTRQQWRRDVTLALYIIGL